MGLGLNPLRELKLSPDPLAATEAYF